MPAWVRKFCVEKNERNLSFEEQVTTSQSCACYFFLFREKVPNCHGRSFFFFFKQKHGQLKEALGSLQKPDSSQQNVEAEQYTEKSSRWKVKTEKQDFQDRFFLHWLFWSRNNGEISKKLVFVPMGMKTATFRFQLQVWKTWVTLFCIFPQIFAEKSLRGIAG